MQEVLSPIPQNWLSWLKRRMYGEVLRTELRPPTLPVEALMPNMTLFGGRALTEVINVEWAHKGFLDKNYMSSHSEG